jgi:uncharacterized protein involved in outer membrane biogenesis
VNAPAVRPASIYHRWPAVLGVAAAALLVFVATCEVLGWPFLAEPLQQWLSASLQRRVSVAIDGHTPASVSVRLFGRLRLEAPQIDVGAPSWSQARHMLLARDAVMSLHYADLWRAHRGQPLRIQMLEAAEVDVDIERLSDGRASWQFGARPQKDMNPHSLEIPLFRHLKAESGTLRYRDEQAGSRIAARIAPAEALPGGEAAASAIAASTLPARGTLAELRGMWRNAPVTITLRSPARLAWVDLDGDDPPQRALVEGSLGDKQLGFDGAAVDVLSVLSTVLKTGANAAQ